MKRSWPGRVGLLFFGAALAAGLFALADLYSSAGNGYSEYSSLRTDRKGAKVLFDAYAGTGGLRVTRNYAYLHDLHAKGATIFIVGMSPDELNEGEIDLKAMEELAQANRLVIALAPAENGGLNGSWGIHFKKMDDGGSCGFSFDRAEEWTEVLKTATTVCAVERSFGSGAIVLMADAHPLTNEGLVSERNGEFLTQLAGSSTQIIFDESHLGIVETGSTLGLARKYRLQGLLWGFALLAGVFIWKTAEPFPPPPVSDAEPTPVLGRDAHAGFLGLLERHIPPARLMEECLREWRLTSPRKEMAADLRSGDPVAQYRAMQEELARKTTYMP